MEFWIVSVVGLLAGCLALCWWRLRALTKAIEQCARRQYYDRRECLDSARRQTDVLAVLRVQLAQVADGHAPDGALVRAGRLYHEVDVDEAGRMVSSGASASKTALVIVDVRSRKEFLAGHIPGARHVPLEALDTRAPLDVPRDAATVLVYCSQGERSRLACDVLSRQGHTNLVIIRDGLQHWTGPFLDGGRAPLIHIQPAGKPARSLVEPAEHHPHG